MDNVKDIYEKMKSFFLGEDEEDYDDEKKVDNYGQSEDPSLLTIRRDQAPKNSQQASKNHQKPENKDQRKSAYSYEHQKDLREQGKSTKGQATSSAKSSSQKIQAGDFKTNKMEEKGRFHGMSREEKFSKIAIREPRVYGDIMDIASLVRDDESVVVNFKLMDDAQARRSIDFFTGVVYTLDGDIQNVGGQIFLLTPASVSVEASAELSLLARQNYDEFNL
ncbi:cell division protein SepF [Streptococcaceae bacterium ESL0729]|nr:cell division protein SepF [Streptococcaceae bacterium ESL0729]